MLSGMVDEHTKRESHGRLGGGITVQFLHHRKHTVPSLQSPTGDVQANARYSL